MSAALPELETIEQVETLDFPNPPTDWLIPTDSVQTYSEGGDYEVSEMSMSKELSEGSPSAICALMATDQQEAESAQPIDENSAGMSKDKNSERASVISACVNSVCEKLHNLSVLPVAFTAFAAKSPATQNQTLTFAAIDAEIKRQDMAVQEDCLNRNLRWVFHAKDIAPWSQEYPFVQALVADTNMLLQPRVYRSSEQYTRTMERITTDVLKAKKLLIEQEIDLKAQEAHHFKSAGLKRAAMASNQSLIRFVENILISSPSLVSDITEHELRQATIREIGSTRCSGHIPVYAGMSYPLPEYLLDYEVSNFVEMQKKDSWAEVVSRKSTSDTVQHMYRSKRSFHKHAHPRNKHNNTVMCFAAVEGDPDETPQGVPGNETPEGVPRDEPPQQVAPVETEREPVPEPSDSKKAKAAAARKAKKEKADAERARKATQSARVTRGSTRVVQTSEGPEIIPPGRPASYEEALAQYVGQTFEGTMFAEMGLPTVATQGASTSMAPPRLPASLGGNPAQRSLISGTPLTMPPATAVTEAGLARPIAAPRTGIPSTTEDAGPQLRTVAEQIRERFQAQFPGSDFPVARVLQTLLPEGYSVSRNDPTLPHVPTGHGCADDPPPRPENLAPREAHEDDATFNARMDAWFRVHSMYLQTLKGYKLRMQTRQMVRSNLTTHDKNLRKISDCTKDTPISDWLRQTRLNLVARHVHEEAEQVKQASSYLYSALQRRWIIAKDKALLENKPITWRMFANHLLTGVDGVQPAEVALKALQTFTVQAGKTASANLYHFQKVWDTCIDCLPGTRYQMPSGYELCTLFVDKVVRHLPKDISNSLIDSYVAQVTQREQTDFFLGDKAVIDDWYREQTQNLLLQGIAKANTMPSVHAPAEKPKGLFDKNHQDDRRKGMPGLSSMKGVKKVTGKRTRDQDRPKGQADPNRKAKTSKYSDFIDSLKNNPKVDIKLLFNEKGRCTFCGMNNHLGKDCRTNIAKKFADDPVRAVNNVVARDLANEFFK